MVNGPLLQLVLLTVSSRLSYKIVANELLVLICQCEAACVSLPLVIVNALLVTLSVLPIPVAPFTGVVILGAAGDRCTTFTL